MIEGPTRGPHDRRLSVGRRLSLTGPLLHRLGGNRPGRVEVSVDVSTHGWKRRESRRVSSEPLTEIPTLETGKLLTRKSLPRRLLPPQKKDLQNQGVLLKMESSQLRELTLEILLSRSNTFPTFYVCLFFSFVF